MTTLTTPVDLRTTCDPVSRTTRTLLAYGVLAGPFYVAVSLAQALTREGFDLTRHSWSLLSNGDLGWIQIANFLLSGLFVIVAAVGFRRALNPGAGSRWAPRLIAVFGLSLICAGIFRADPAAGFPVGTPADASTMSWHGLLHLVCGAIGFLCLIAACFVFARRFGSEGRRGRAAHAMITGVVFFGGFVGIASGQGNPVTIITFVIAILVVWTWIATTSLHLYRRQSR